MQAQKHEPMLLLYSGLVRDFEECCWCPQYPVLHLIAPRVPWCHTTQMVTAFPHDRLSLDMCETTNKQKSLWNNCFIFQAKASLEVLLNLYLCGETSACRSWHGFVGHMTSEDGVDGVEETGFSSTYRTSPGIYISWSFPWALLFDYKAESDLISDCSITLAKEK